jgi:hypothetical protein
VQKGVWVTQIHNEPVLDQAFRTSKEVILIFGANKTSVIFPCCLCFGTSREMADLLDIFLPFHSGEFFGYAKYVSSHVYVVQAALTHTASFLLF